MTLAPVLLALLTAAPVTSPLETALGMELPSWGASAASLERHSPHALEPYHPEPCPTEIVHPESREWRNPPLTLASVPLLKVAFLQTGQGLESIAFQPLMGPYEQLLRWGKQMEAHLERHLGPPAVRTKLGAYWELPGALVMRTGFVVFVSDPKSPFARQSIQAMRKEASALQPNGLPPTAPSR